MQWFYTYDEMQFIVKKEKLEQFKTTQSIFKKTQDHFIQLQLDGEIKVGQNGVIHKAKPDFDKDLKFGEKYETNYKSSRG